MFQGVFVVSARYDNVSLSTILEPQEHKPLTVQSWKKQRKIFNSIVGTQGAKNFLPYQDFESKQYVVDMIKAPDQYYFHAERFGASLLTTTVYGQVWIPTRR